MAINITNISNVNLRPLPLTPTFGRPFGIRTGTGVNLRPYPLPITPIVSPIGSIQNLWQQYEIQTFTADKGLVTRRVTYGQLFDIFGFNFTPEDAGNLTASTKGTEAKLLDSANISHDDANKILQDSVKVDYLLCMKSQESLPVEFNTLQTPSLSAEFSYNFYTTDETDMQSQEDQSLDPLLTKKDPPRYVLLRWDSTTATGESLDFAARTSAESQLVAGFLSSPRGNSTISNSPIPNSFQRNAKKTYSLSRNGQSMKLVDTHDLERGFNSTSNARLFKNAALATLNVNSVDVDTLNFSDIFLKDL